MNTSLVLPALLALAALLTGACGAAPQQAAVVETRVVTQVVTQIAEVTREVTREVEVHPGFAWKPRAGRQHNRRPRTQDFVGDRHAID